MGSISAEQRSAKRLSQNFWETAGESCPNAQVRGHRQVAHSWEDTPSPQAGLCEGPITGTSRTSRQARGQAGKAAEVQTKRQGWTQDLNPNRLTPKFVP